MYFIFTNTPCNVFFLPYRKEHNFLFNSCFFGKSPQAIYTFSWVQSIKRNYYQLCLSDKLTIYRFRTVTKNLFSKRKKKTGNNLLEDRVFSNLLLYVVICFSFITLLMYIFIYIHACLFFNILFNFFKLVVDSNITVFHYHTFK